MSITTFIRDNLLISASEKLKDFIAKTGGTEIAATKSIPDALGTDGTTVTDTAVSVLGAVGANNANNAFDSSSVVANPDGSVLEREESIQAQIEYGILSVEADAGTTSTNIIDAAALTQATDDWWKGALLLSINGQNEDQSRPIISFSAATDSVDVYPAFLNTPDAGDDFLVISSWRPALFDQQPDTAVSVNAILASETNIFDLNVTGTTYQVNNLRLKSVDPGAETITVRLRELINDVSTIVDTFTIDTTNFGTYHSLMDMFGLPQLTGDDIQVTVQASAVGPYAITGQYQHSLSKSG